MIFDVLLKGGFVIVGGELTTCDIGIREGLVVALGRYLASDRVCPVFDVRGKWVLPSFCDVYSQATAPYEGELAQTQLLAHSKRAALSGVTFISELVLPKPWESVFQAVERRVVDLSKAFVDFGFSARVMAGRVPSIDELVAGRQRGLCSLVATLSPRTDGFGLDDAELLLLAKNARAASLSVSVLLEHPVFGREVKPVVIGALKRLPRELIRHYSDAGEFVAASRALAVAEVAGAPIELLGVSTAQTLALVNRARKRGVKTRAQIFAHSLLLSQNVYRVRRGRWYRPSPPLRDSETLGSLWRQAKQWSIAWGIGEPPLVSLTPWTIDEHATFEPFWNYPTGALLARMSRRTASDVSFNPHDGKRLAGMVMALSKRPFHYAGFGDERGAISVSSVADLCVWDPTSARVGGPKKPKSSDDFNHFMGLSTLAAPTLVFNRGQLVAEAGVLKAKAPQGKLAVPMVR